MKASIIRPKENSQLPTIPSQLTLRDIIKTLPSEVFTKNMTQAWLTVIVSVLCAAVGYLGLILSPWWLLPPLWVFTGTTLAGWFVIGHDCGHRSFAKRNWVNNLVGQLLMLPLMYPFHSWRILHNHHHKHTNKLGVDNAWDPLTVEVYETMPGWVKWWYQRIRGNFWWIGSIVHKVQLHFNWSKFEGKERQQIKFSAILVLVTGTIFFPTLLLTTGIWGFVKFWLLPWLIYHFWTSTFTLVHHTMSEITFKPPAQWNEAEAQLTGTVHCDYPFWVEFLCHHINVHIPHHVSTGIPSYNLRKAHESLKQNWGEYIYECKFSWDLMQKITTQCHLYDAEANYISFTQHDRAKSLKANII
ncbi:MAG: fatty acid desaturase [Prochloraceae cyanobacterium]|nr:fatty acid desaturase [Prochloraceae cyanobacterium]